MSGTDADRPDAPDRRLGVLLLFDSAFPYSGGGRETGIYHICKYGCDRLDVRILTYRPARGLTQARFSDADAYCRLHPVFTFQSLARMRGYNAVARTVDHLLFPAMCRRAARSVTHGWRPDVVLCLHASPLAMAAHRLARQLGARSAINMRSYYCREIAGGRGLLRHALPYLRRAERQAMQRVDMVLANGEDTFEYARAIRGPEKRTVLVHNGVDTQLFAPGPGDAVRARLGWGDCVVFMSNNPMRRIKGPQDAIAALARMPADVRRRCRVVFFSKTEAVFAPYRDLARSLGVGEQVVVLGHVRHEDLPAYLNAADVALHPVLFSAGTTHASLETLACGLPQVSYNAAGLRSTCITGETGILVEPGDVDGLARAMTELASDADMRKRMAVAARERSLAFDWPKYLDRYVAVLRDLVGTT